MELMPKLQPGTSWRIFYSKGNVNNRTVHILAVVDEDFVVHKYWLYRKRRWHYAVEHVEMFYLLDNDGHLTQAK